jgi:hypothetical protein
MLVAIRTRRYTLRKVRIKPWIGILISGRSWLRFGLADLGACQKCTLYGPVALTAASFALPYIIRYPYESSLSEPAAIACNPLHSHPSLRSRWFAPE